MNLYAEYDVKRGLRESDGKGVLTGLTEISDVTGFKTIQGEKVPCEGELYYQGYNVMDLKKGFKQRRFKLQRKLRTSFCSVRCRTSSSCGNLLIC